MYMIAFPLAFPPSAFLFLLLLPSVAVFCFSLFNKTNVWRSEGPFSGAVGHDVRPPVPLNINEGAATPHSPINLSVLAA